MCKGLFIFRIEIKDYVTKYVNSCDIDIKFNNLAEIFDKKCAQSREYVHKAEKMRYKVEKCQNFS